MGSKKYYLNNLFKSIFDNNLKICENKLIQDHLCIIKEAKIIV